MGKKCIPGILCIENYTLLFLTFVIFVILYFMYIKYTKNLNKYIYSNNSYSNSNSNNNNSCNEKHSSYNYDSIPILGNGYNNKDHDVLLNPYSAPMRDDRVYNNSNYGGPRVAINIPTQSINTNYRQIGILTRVNGSETILPLLGRPLFTNRDKWNFYTMNDKNGMIKLPVRFKNKSCTSCQGCDNLYSGDTVYVEGYSDTFRVTIYDNNTLEYIPSL
jgi:hypothetical protein